MVDKVRVFKKGEESTENQTGEIFGISQEDQDDILPSSSTSKVHTTYVLGTWSSSSSWDWDEIYDPKFDKYEGKEGKYGQG